MRISSRINHDAVYEFDRLCNLVTQTAFMIALIKFNFDLKFFCSLLKGLFNFRKGFHPIEFSLPSTKKLHIGTVHHKNFHPLDSPAP